MFKTIPELSLHKIELNRTLFFLRTSNLHIFFHQTHVQTCTRRKASRWIIPGSPGFSLLWHRGRLWVRIKDLLIYNFVGLLLWCVETGPCPGVGGGGPTAMKKELLNILVSLDWIVAYKNLALADWVGTSTGVSRTQRGLSRFFHLQILPSLF